MISVEEIVKDSEVIINGYALQKIPKGIRVVNIHRLDRVAVFSLKGELLETSMDDIELHIARGYLARGLSYMEEEDAEVL